VQQKREISRSFQACQVTTDLQNNLYNNHVKFEEETIPVAAFADTKFIRLLYNPSLGLEGMNLHKAILNGKNQLLHTNESLSNSNSFKNLFSIFAYQLTYSSFKISSIKNSRRVETNMSIYGEYHIPLGKIFGDTTY